jgi:hypothetical protein
LLTLVIAAGQGNGTVLAPHRQELDEKPQVNEERVDGRSPQG